MWLENLLLCIRNLRKSQPFIERYPNEVIWDYWKRINYEPNNDIKRKINKIRPNFYKDIQ
jgi:hypothetical protein